GPEVLVAVEARGAGPVLPGELERVLDAHAPLLGRVHEEEPAEGPPGLPAEARLRLLLEDRDALARVDELCGGDEPREPRPDDDRVAFARARGGRVRHPCSFVVCAPAFIIQDVVVLV